MMTETDESVVDLLFHPQPNATDEVLIYLEARIR